MASPSNPFVTPNHATQTTGRQASAIGHYTQDSSADDADAAPNDGHDDSWLNEVLNEASPASQTPDIVSKVPRVKRIPLTHTTSE